jgi:hypothetical protein
VYFLATRVPGPDWNVAAPMEAQARWPDHAAFMNALATEGFILLGGPVGTRTRFLHLCAARSADEVRARFAADPWPTSMLELASVEPWTIVLRHDGS